MQETQETRVQSLDQEDPLKEGMATLSSILAWKIPWTEEPGGLQFMGFSRQEYWRGLPCPPSQDLPDPETEPTSLMSPVLTGRFLTTNATWEAQSGLYSMELDFGFCCLLVSSRETIRFCLFSEPLLTYSWSNVCFQLS